MPPTDRATTPTPAVRRLLAALVVVTLSAAGLAWVQASAEAPRLPSATPQARCQGPDDRLETGRQGRVPLSDYTSGRYRRGYQCNTVQVAQQGGSGGFKVLRYRDRTGRVCAFYDSTLLFPRDVLFNATQGLGVVVLDMTNPTRPRKTAQLTSPAMLSPHESLLVNQRRGILAAVLGNPATNVGVVDLYDVRTDCRKPRLLSSSRKAAFGHESGFSPDGRTFWVAGAAGQNLTAVDITKPREPRTIFEQSQVNYHGLRFSQDGRTMYVANLGTQQGPVETVGLRVLDVSAIQDRRRDPKVRVVSDLTWGSISLPQVAEPFTRNGRPYLLEVDEYQNFSGDQAVGAARIIDIADPRRPTVVSDLRLAVHQPANRQSQLLDPGAAIPVQGYAGHYCSVPYPTDPKIVACSMIASGLRLFDISNLEKPREIGYFNRPILLGSKTLNPTALGAFAMSQPAWDVERRQVWYSDGNSGFYVVGLRGGIGRLLRR
ncbi:hypothetical protein [Nocardioides sp.]|uniref:LVIVD repeat-containing protein n=1 Tax=Nocardioides sp. TaxID=35761 RepID=UPI00286ABF75|nr:hypothetical protein [Nocardioides sp.]